MKTRRALHTIALLSSVIVTAGCRDSDLMNHRRFILASIDGTALPAIEHETVSGRYIALADTIVITSRTRGLHTRVTRIEPTTSQPPETIRVSTVFTYEINESLDDSSAPAGTIVMTYVCGDNPLADCLAGPHLSGVLADNVMKLHNLHLSPERERRYVER